jgi:hypothetical protein
MKSKTIVFVHGMYMNPLCWEQWVDYYQAKGYKCLAPLGLAETSRLTCFARIIPTRN